MNSEHAWVLENLETYTAGGLDPAETERLTQHIAGCPPCEAALAEARALDQAMTTVFAEVRPSSALEDRMLRALRTGALRRNLRLKRFLLPAAVVLFGIVGFGVNGWISKGELAFPSMGSLSRNLAMGTSETSTAGPSAVAAKPDFSKVEAASRPAATAGYDPGQPGAEGRDWGRVGIFQRAEALGRQGASQPQQQAGDDESLGERAGKSQAPSFASANMRRGGEVPGNTSSPTKPDSFTLTTNNGESISKHVYQEGEAISVDKLAQKTRESLSTASQPEPSLPALEDKSVDRLPADQINNFGYYPPARALVAKGSSRFHFSPGGGTVSTRGGKPGQEPPQGMSIGGNSQIAGNPVTKDDVNKTEQNQYFGLDKDAKDRASPTWAPIIPNAESGQRGLKEDQKLGEKKEAAAQQVAQQAGDAEKPAEAKSPAQTPAEKRLETAQRFFAQGRGAASVEDLRQAALEVQKEKEEINRANQASAVRKIIIRTGDIEYEIESFDAAVAGITKITNAIPGAFIATVNSEKLPNGKVRGSVVVRIPPEQLDSFVLDLRKDLGKGGELKSLKIGSQDITKQYTDLESRLKAARTMEERLLLIIKNGKGEIKDLLATEKELGNWRTQIESIEGELRFYGSQVALSTLTISLYEREIKAPYGLVTTERVQMGVEVEEVDKALQTALKAVSEVKGRVTKSELKQHAAGQFSALLHFEVAPASAGPMRDRLRQLGTVTRLDVDRLQEAEGGTGPAIGAPVKEKDAQFQVSLYNIANVAPRETVVLNLACTDAEAVYQSLLTQIRKTAGARVVTSNLNRQKNDQSTGTLNFEVKTSEADALLAELKKAGEVLQLQFTENPDTQTVTLAKRGFNVQLVGMGAVVPRETTVLQIAARDVPAAERALQNAVNTVNGRIMNAQVNEQDRQNITAQLDFDVRRSELAQVDAALAQAGDVIRRDVSRAQEGDNVLDSKMRFQVALIAQSRIPARETTVLGIEVVDVDTTKETFEALAKEKQGRVAASTIARERSGRVTAKLTFDMPLAAADSLAARFKSAGKVRVQQSSQNLQVPEGPLAIGRVDVTLSNEDLIVPSDEGLWPQVRKGLSTSFFALAWSLTVVIVGACFVLPWGLVSYGGYRLWQRVRPKQVGQ